VDGGPGRELLTIKEPERFAYGGSFAWTPDSRWIVFARGTNFNYELWRISADGSGLRKIGLNMWWMRRLDIHPDGKRITFQAGIQDWELWAMENLLAGANPHN
jgi:Tol biopolymer transport system component